MCCTNREAQNHQFKEFLLTEFTRPELVISFGEFRDILKPLHWHNFAQKWVNNVPCLCLNKRWLNFDHVETVLSLKVFICLH